MRLVEITSDIAVTGEDFIERTIILGPDPKDEETAFDHVRKTAYDDGFKAGWKTTHDRAFWLGFTLAISVACLLRVFWR